LQGRKNPDATASFISIAKSSASTVDSVILYFTGVDLLEIPQIPMIKYEFRKSGLVIVGGTMPVNGSQQASLLQISHPLRDFFSAHFSLPGLILASALMYSMAFSIFLG
jgi:hypothetical protein